MENQRTQGKIGMTYGAFYGLSSTVIFLICYFIGTDIQSKIPQYLSYVAMIAFIVIGIKSYRDQELGGYITYGKSLGTGTLIALFGGIISGAFTLIFFRFIAPDMVQKILDSAQQNMVTQGYSDEQIEMGMIYVRKFTTPFWLFFFSLLGSAIIGFIFSLVISIFMKKDQNPFNSNIG